MRDPLWKLKRLSMPGTIHNTRRKTCPWAVVNVRPVEHKKKSKAALASKTRVARNGGAA